MNEKYLIINAGSSSLKFSLYEMPEAREIVNGIVEKIGKSDSFYTLKIEGAKVKKNKTIKDHTEAVQVMISELLSNGFIRDINEIKAVGHRIVQGGSSFDTSVEMTDDNILEVKKFSSLAPLHNPPIITVVEVAKKLMPEAVHTGVFDTAFHQTMPEENYMYAVPYSWYKENNVRKYGFHGTSHKYITETMKDFYNKDDVNLIVCHIGSGASISCIKNGKCYDTSMGMTPLDGLVMGTRSGSIDPSIVEYISKEREISASEVTDILNKESGLLGIAGKNDFRDLSALAFSGDEKAILAIKMFEKSIIKYIAEYYFELDGKVDALVFTAGIGENVSMVRRDIVNAISNSMNIRLNDEINEKIAAFKEYQEGIISTWDSSFDVVVVPTDEEYMILMDTYKISQEKNNSKKRVLR